MKHGETKLIRNVIKTDHLKADFCYITRAIHNLELHHMYPLSSLWVRWKHQHGLTDLTEADVKRLRYHFLEDMDRELNTYLTLCQDCHRRLHDTFTLSYSPDLVPAVLQWVETRRAQHDWEPDIPDLRLLQWGSINNKFLHPLEQALYYRLSEKPLRTQKQQTRLDSLEIRMNDQRFVNSILSAYQKEPREIKIGLMKQLHRLIQTYRLEQEFAEHRGVSIYR